MSFFSRDELLEEVEGGAFAAFNAVLTGDVTLGVDANIWFGSVLRGDDGPIHIGARTNIQDLCMVHPDPGVPLVVGEQCTVGHRAVLHGIEVGDRCLIGMGAILLTGSVIGSGSIVAAGAVVKERFEVPPRTLVAGVPARIIRELGEAEAASILESSREYVEKVRLYLRRGRT